MQLTDNETNVRTAVIGVGYFGNLHASKYAAAAGADLIAVCDTDARRAEDVAARYGARAVTDHRELIGDVDAVSVVVPTRSHFDVARDFLDNGIDVLLEKPMCENLAQADELIALAEERGRILQVGHLERFSPVIQALVEITDRPGYIETHRISRFQGRGTDTTVILDMMIHDIDHLLQIAGSPIAQIDAVGVPVLTDAEDIANARIRFENGCVATVTASRVSWKVKRTLRLFQPDAYIVVDMGENRMVVMQRTGGDGTPVSLGAEDKTFEPVDLLALQADHFLECVKTRQQPIVTGKDVRPVLAAALEVTDQLRQWRGKLD
ncbi:MAG: Gfo/Idh/MocA family oxidoreductase [Pseudomonadota bacterium]